MKEKIYYLVNKDPDRKLAQSYLRSLRIPNKVCYSDFMNFFYNYVESANCRQVATQVFTTEKELMDFLFNDLNRDTLSIEETKQVISMLSSQDQQTCTLGRQLFTRISFKYPKLYSMITTPGSLLIPSNFRTVLLFGYKYDYIHK